MREVHRVQVFDFGGFPDLMADGLSARMLMEHRDAQGVREEIESPGISSVGDFLGTTSSYTAIKDPILRLCHRLIACSIAGRSQAPEKVTVTDLFYLRGIDGLTIIAPALPIIDMAELPDVAAGTPRVAQDAPAVDEGDQAVPAPVQAPQQPPPPPLTAARTMPQRLGRLEEELMEASGLKYQAFAGTFRGSSPAAFQRRTRQRTRVASTSTAQPDQQQPDL
ncbi:hypothetical protein Tco_1025169 [Tanacetum coccineum]